MSIADEDEQLIRLKDAVPIAFPNGGAGLSALRKEVAKGNLTVVEIAGKHFTSRRYIREMEEKCRVKPKGRASGSARKGSARTAIVSLPAPGSLSTDASKSRQDWLAMKLAKLPTH